jgi:hypothetical protein
MREEDRLLRARAFYKICRRGFFHKIFAEPLSFARWRDIAQPISFQFIRRRSALGPHPKYICQPFTTRLNVLPNQAPIFALNSFVGLRVDRSADLSE